MDGAHHGAVLGMGEVSQNAAEGESGDAIETGGGLVQEEETRLHEKLHGHAQTLALSAGNALLQRTAYGCVLAVLETDLDNDLVHPLELVVSAHLGGKTQERRISQRLLHREVGEQQIVLVVVGCWS